MVFLFLSLFSLFEFGLVGFIKFCFLGFSWLVFMLNLWYWPANSLAIGGAIKQFHRYCSLFVSVMVSFITLLYDWILYFMAYNRQSY